MSGPALQPMGSYAPPAPVSAAPPQGTPLPGAPVPAAPDAPPLPSPAAASPVELEFSELGRILEKLALMTGAETKGLGQLIDLVRSQGQMLGVLQLMNLARRADSGNGPALPEALRALADQILGQAGQTGSPENGASTPPPASAMLQELQGKVTQSIQTFAATLKASLAPLMELPEAKHPGTPAGPAPEPAAGLAQFVQAQVEQATGAFRQLAAHLPALLQPAVLAGAPETALAAALEQLNGAPLAPAPDGAEATEAGRLAGVLSQLQKSGKPGENPLVRQDYIKSTMGLVSSLLADPATAPGATRAANRPAAPTPPSTATGTSPATDSHSALPDRVKTVIQELGSARGLMTAPGGEAWAKIEKVLGALGQSAETAPQPGGQNMGNLPPERLAELARRGVLFEVEFKADAKLETIAAALRRQGIQAEVARDEELPIAKLRLTLPGKDPQAVPVRLDPPDAPEAAKPARTAVHGGTEPRGAGTQSDPQTSAPARGEEASRSALAALAAERGGGREAAPATPRDTAAAQFRPDQYTHPEAFRLPPHANPKAVAGLAAFFQAHREEAILGREFEDTAPEAAPGASGRKPITDPRRLLEYKPIEVIRPEKSEAGAPKAAKAPLFSDAKPSAEQPREKPAETIIDIKPVAVGRR